jgi:hypothetical protein
VLPGLLKSVEDNSTSRVDVVCEARDAVKHDPELMVPVALC